MHLGNLQHRPNYRPEHEQDQRSLFGMRLVTLACLLLLTLLTLVQVAHVHPAATDADHCPICVVMHSAAPVAILAAAIISSRGSSPVLAPVLTIVVRPWSHALFNRPPPTQG